MWYTMIKRNHTCSRIILLRIYHRKQEYRSTLHCTMPLYTIHFPSDICPPHIIWWCHSVHSHYHKRSFCHLGHFLIWALSSGLTQLTSPLKYDFLLHLIFQHSLIQANQGPDMKVISIWIKFQFMVPEWIALWGNVLHKIKYILFMRWGNPDQSSANQLNT